MTSNKKLNVLPEHQEKLKEGEVVGPGRFPSWLHRSLPKGGQLEQTGQLLSQHRLHTVCEEARCPNLLECWSKKTATFLAMGKECSRNCGFCDIDFSKAPKPLEEDEPRRIADSIVQLGLKHVVITMVARDDLPDGGSRHLIKIMQAVRERSPESTIEVLTSDFNGNQQSWQAVIDGEPEIFNHNIETVRELTPRVRHKATYERTLALLSYVAQNRKASSLLVKSGLMVGLGETEAQVYQTLKDLKEAGCDIVTMGQYLQANPRKLLVKSFVTPAQFKIYEQMGQELGISHMYCGPFVRSSYNAQAVLMKATKTH
jgi:lipoic acid synthetase